jgi:hypothetical protein
MSTAYIPRLRSSPTQDQIRVALMVRGGEFGDPHKAGLGEPIFALSQLSLPALAQECAYWQYGATQASFEESLRGEFALSGGQLMGAFDSWFNTTLAESFADAEDKSANLMWVTEVPNYKVGRVIVPRDTAVLMSRGHGTANLLSLTAYAVEWLATEFAAAIKVNEVDLIDDNFHAIRACAKNLGRAPKRLKNDLFFSSLLSNPILPCDGERLFSPAHSNYMTGESSELMASNGGLGSAIKKIREQITTENGEIIHHELRPRYLLVPPALEQTAKQALRLQMLDDPKVDLQLIVSSRMSAVGVVDPITGEIHVGSDTNWALFCDASEAPCFACGYLAGQQQPAVRMASLGGGGVGGMWGLSWDIRQGIAVAGIDYKGAVWSDGK